MVLRQLSMECLSHLNNLIEVEKMFRFFYDFILKNFLKIVNLKNILLFIQIHAIRFLEFNNTSKRDLIKFNHQLRILADLYC